MLVEKAVYTAERFIADVRQVFASSKDPRQGKLPVFCASVLRR